MEEMFKQCKEMMNSLCSEDKMKCMQGIFESCFSTLSDEEKKSFFKEACPNPMGENSDMWDEMPKMMMSMMNMMSMMLMKDMMSGGKAPAESQAKTAGPMGGMGMGRMSGMGGMMNGMNPMKMMQKMMGGGMPNMGGAQNAPAEGAEANDESSG